MNVIGGLTTLRDPPARIGECPVEVRCSAAAGRCNSRPGPATSIAHPGNFSLGRVVVAGCSQDQVGEKSGDHGHHEHVGEERSSDGPGPLGEQGELGDVGSGARDDESDDGRGGHRRSGMPAAAAGNGHGLWAPAMPARASVGTSRR